MDPWQRKRTRPAHVASNIVRYSRNRSPPNKVPRAEEEPSCDPWMAAFMAYDWCSLIESEIERRIAERLNEPSFPTFNANQTVFLNSASTRTDDFEELTRDSDEETIVNDEEAEIIEISDDEEPISSKKPEEYDPSFPSYEGSSVLKFAMPETPPPSASYEAKSFQFPPLPTLPPPDNVAPPPPPPEDVLNLSTLAQCDDIETEDPLNCILPPFNCGIPASGPRSILWYVRDVCKYDEANRPAPLTQNSERELAKRKTTIMLTEDIPEGSPYWRECLRAVEGKEPGTTIEISSKYDHVPIVIHKFKRSINKPQCRVKACRNHVNVILFRETDTFMRDENVEFQGALRVIHNDPSRTRIGRIPTEMIPWNSNYYSELLRDATFPRAKSNWIHRKGRDGVWVHFHLGQQGRSLFAMRNGVTVQLYPHF
ncbi:hypothetical protein ACFFRR_005666 [Megaselia abdita]